jgi:hypothetical protein
VIGLVLVHEIDRHSLSDLVVQTECRIERKIRTLVVSSPEWDDLKPVTNCGNTLMLREAPLDAVSQEAKI